MAKEKWVETKRESELNEQGQYIIKKVTHELDSYRRKEKIDLGLRCLALLVVISPLIVLFINQRNETAKAKKIYSLEVYPNTTIAVREFLDAKFGTEEFNKLKDDLYLRFFTKIQIIGDVNVVKPVDTLKAFLEFYVAVQSSINLIDSLQTNLSRIDTSYELCKQYISDAQRELHQLFNYRRTFTRCDISNLGEIKWVTEGFKEFYLQELEKLKSLKNYHGIADSVSNNQELLHNYVYYIKMFTKERTDQIESIVIQSLKFQQ